MRQIANSPVGHQAWPAPRPTRLAAEPLWESVAAVVVAIMYATNVVEISLAIGATGESYPPQVRLAYLLTYAVFAGLLLISREPVWTLPFKAPLLVLVVAMAPISILWSVAPGETLERSVSVVGSSLFGAYLGWRFSLGRMIFLLAVAMSIAVGLSALAIVLLPSLGITSAGPWAGTWQGVHFHKSALGAAAALACLVTGYAVADNRGLVRLGFAAAFVVAAVLLVGSNSTTALIIAIVLGILAIWTRYLQLLPRQIPVLTLIVVFGLLVIGPQAVGTELIERALAVFGKGSDLSSRVPLWELVWERFIPERFWLGYGYEAFWRPDSPAMRLILSELYFVPFYSHNGLLETWLNGGLALVVLVIMLILSVITRSLILFVRWRSLAVSSFPLLFCGYFLLMNFAESAVLTRNDLIWAIFVAVAVFVAKWVRLRAD